jgi:hypothetical protein
MIAFSQHYIHFDLYDSSFTMWLVNNLLKMPCAEKQNGGKLASIRIYEARKWRHMAKISRQAAWAQQIISCIPRQ